MIRYSVKTHCHFNIHHCQLLRLVKKLIFKKIFKKFELNKTKNGGFPKSYFRFALIIRRF